MKRAIGLTMALIPFLLIAGMLTWIMVKQEGWLQAGLFWGTALLFGGMIIGGLKLASGQ